MIKILRFNFYLSNKIKNYLAGSTLIRFLNMFSRWIVIFGIFLKKFDFLLSKNKKNFGLNINKKKICFIFIKKLIMHNKK